MRKVHCADCGKSYDYDVDDFCPRCGSFNPPPDSGATRLEQELLSRFQRPGAVGQPGKKVRTVNYHPTYGSGPDLKKGRVHTASIKSCAACGPEKKKKSGVKTLVILLVILGILFVGVPLVQVVVEEVMDAVTDLAYSYDNPEGVFIDEEPVLPEGWYESYDTITLSNGQEVSVGDGWEPWLPEEVTDQYPGTRCVAVALWVLGEPGESYIPVTLMAEDGTSYLPEELPAWVVEECGLDCVSLADGTANEELFGYLFYFLPEDVTKQDLTAVLMDEENVYVDIDVEVE